MSITQKGQKRRIFYLKYCQKGHHWGISLWGAFPYIELNLCSHALVAHSFP